MMPSMIKISSNFLQVYFYDRVKRFPRARFLFAFSEHGAASDDDSGSGYLLFSNAKSFSDHGNALSLASLRIYLQGIARRSFQTLALINSCYGGGFLDKAFGTELTEINRPGAHGITAGAADELVYSVPEVGPCSVFFETLLAGIEGGRADAFPVIEDKDGTPISRGDGIVTYNEVVADLKSSIGYKRLNGKPVQEPLDGSIEPRERMGAVPFSF